MNAAIHIGTPKSGTTTVQSFLALNRAALSSQGFRYEPFDPRQSSQMELGLTGVVRSGGTLKAANRIHALGLRTPAEQRAYVARFEAMLREGAENWPEHTYLASSEHVHAWLSTRSRITALHDMLSTHFENVRYVVYYRPQEEFMLSTYSERIKRGEHLTFDRHFEQRLERMDYHRRAMRWASTVGRENLSVRLLDRSWLQNGDLLDDFCTVVGVDRTPLEDPPRMNVSLSAEELELYLSLGKRVPARHRNGKPNPVFFFLLRLLRRRLPKPGTRIRLTDKQRERIHAYCDEANERLRAEFFPERATLFGAQ